MNMYNNLFQMSYSNETGAEYDATQLRLNPTYIW
jgi:hypothetical protein